MSADADPARPAPEAREEAGASSGPRDRSNKSVARATRLLTSFSEEAPEWSVSELAAAHGISKSTVSTLLTTLAHEELVTQSPVTRRYRLGLRCLEMGYLASSGLLVRDLAFPFLASLHGDEDHIVYLAIPYQQELLYVEALYPLLRRINVSALGRRAPLYCTGIGKALLAYLPEGDRAGYLARAPFSRLTDNTLTTRASLQEELDEIRRRGYAEDREEREQGIRCVAAPVLDHGGHAVAAVSVSAAAERLPAVRRRELATRVTATARAIGRKVRQAGLARSVPARETHAAGGLGEGG